MRRTKEQVMEMATFRALVVAALGERARLAWDAEGWPMAA
jgi:hypothetical protein